MKRKEFYRAERREVSEKDFTDAVKTLLESPPVKVPDRTPSRKELNEKHRLDRVKK